MQIIVIGCGKVGSNLARALAREGHDVVIVDSDREAFKLLGSDFNGITIAGVPIDQDVLRHAGIETADALAAVTPDDNINIMTCQIANEFFKVPRVIARIYNPEREQVFHEFGLETICPTTLTVDTIRASLSGGESASVHTISGCSFVFRQEKVDQRYDGKKLSSYKTEKEASIFGVIQGGQFKFTDPDIVLHTGDLVITAQRANCKEVKG